MIQLKAKPLTREAFSGYGQVIEKEGANSFPINAGNCTRYHDLAVIEITGDDCRPIISIVSGKPYKLPIEIPMVERHPFGSQAFIPTTDHPFLVVVCKDQDGVPVDPLAFVTSSGQGVNIGRNVWHGILTPLEGVSDFVVVDWAGKGVNLEEYFFDEPFIVS
ncbi:MAG: ureidoglycolate lyase [Nitratireductor sp.]|nr:ureidoglycolate lyase [Nitratireductor sp.]